MAMVVEVPHGKNGDFPVRKLLVYKIPPVSLQDSPLKIAINPHDLIPAAMAHA